LTVIKKKRKYGRLSRGYSRTNRNQAGMGWFEKGIIKKDHGCGLNIVLVYPGTYRTGASNLGLQVLYRIINGRSGSLAERCFISSKGTPKSVESARPLSDFDVIAFTIPFEEGAWNVARALIRAGLSPRPEDRRKHDPLVVAGGMAPTMNPEPYLSMVDAVGLGDAEVLVPRALDNLEIEPKASLEQKIEAIRKVDGWLTFDATPDFSVTRQFLFQLTGGGQPAATTVLCPDAELGSMALIEVARGCVRGCRFCASGYVCRPPRFWPLDDMEREIARLSDLAGKVGLVASDLSDHPELEEIIDMVEKNGAKASPSSLRADKVSLELLDKLSKHGLRTLTMAPEVGREDLRRAINKDMEDQVLVDAGYMAGKTGIPNLKLYFILGLPGQEDDDIHAMVHIVEKISKARERGAARSKGSTGMTHVSLSLFVPKPGTPLQWSGMKDPATLNMYLKQAKKSLSKIGGVRVNAESLKSVYRQALLSRGSREVGNALVQSVESGIDIDSILNSLGLDPNWIAFAERSGAADLPWDRVGHGTGTEVLLRERDLLRQGKPSANCTPGKNCHRCDIGRQKICPG